MGKGNIILIGFMGAGKTTAGKHLAERESMKFVDTDDLISANEGCTINDIFAEHGEEYFRNLETSLLIKMCDNTENTVVSCGGGMPLREENRTYLKKLGRVVYLSVLPDTVIYRLSGDNTRPLLQGSAEEVENRIMEMIMKRNDSYKASADIEIIADEKSVEDIVDCILENIK